MRASIVAVVGLLLIKKPGDMAKARQRHLQNQERRDALAKLRNFEPIEIWAHYETGSAKVKVVPFMKDEPYSQDQVLCIFNRRLRVMTYVEKDGCRVVDSCRYSIIPLSQIVGKVAEILETAQSKKS